MRSQWREQPRQEESDKSSGGSADQGDQAGAIIAGNSKKPKGRRAV